MSNSTSNPVSPPSPLQPTVVSSVSAENTPANGLDQNSSSPSQSTSSDKSPYKARQCLNDKNDKEDPWNKRHRNTMAARRYRQRRVDRLADLERRLEEMTSERDDMRVRLARREAEVGALRDVLSAKK
ncbi:bZIP transcription factor [Geosmithia morbida]|uniref:BZIP transcription factor n=1 Tax=Geosmithia morbida TaxID=1094350 RepID=A0A9P4YSD2_9HYPO|nr:bZIP transcription factor [Geosmithia morbida]KAF4120909.1 bZIP transcription factor [Geosmithia morbida]